MARTPAVFCDGWGDPAAVATLDIGLHPLSPPPPLTVRWERRWSNDGLEVRDASFSSPAPLPSPASHGRLRTIAPAGGAARWCVVMPAWNDEGFHGRTPFAVSLARRGVGAVLLECPYYGSRRVHTLGPAIRTVADFALMGRAVVVEALGLLTTFAERGPVGVTGYSMGGNLAAFVGALAPRPIALAPLAASPSPAPVFCTGVLRHGIRWDALGGSEAPSRLADALGAVSVLSLPSTPTTSRAVLVAALHDGFVPPSATATLHAHWPGSELRWVRAGHGTLWWLRRRVLVAAVLEAFDRTDPPPPV